MAKKHHKLKKFLLIISIFIIIFLVSISCFIIYHFNKYDLNIGQLTKLNNGIEVYSYEGNDLTLCNTNRSIIEIDNIPNYVKDAFIAIEDKRFYYHNGYDLKRIIKSGFVNIINKSKSQGASTISQQLIKNALLTNEKTYSRKIKEVVLSVKMEKKFSKDEILQMYLNTIYFGSNAYGIENASKTYFNKSAKDLNLNEACCLAGIIKSPALYSPKYNYKNAVERKNLVASLLYKENKITFEEYQKVTNLPITITNNNNFDFSYEEEAIYEACFLLNITERELLNKQYKIITFKDKSLQNEVVKINKEVINNAQTNTNSSLDSLSVIANNEGHVLAYYANSKYNLHNLRRQPASTLKPLAVYLPCISHNILMPASQIVDEPINYDGFAPNNADKKYYGNVSARFALAHSLNIPAVKALDYLGTKKAQETLGKLGILTSKSDANLSLALGSLKNGVNVLDLLSAYSTLANYGKKSNLTFIYKILDKNNNVIYECDDYKEEVIDEESCFLVTNMLKDCAKYGTAKRLSSLNLPIASKTGTASIKVGNTDLYNIAYTTEHTMLTWIADVNNNILPSSLLSSIQPTEINKQLCAYLYKNDNLQDFKIPNNVSKMPYDIAELTENNILIEPSHSVERYIGYDYFKNDFKPQKNNNNNINFNVILNDTTTLISFNAKKHLHYYIYKNNQLFEVINNKNGKIEIQDHNIYSTNRVDYYITDEYNNRLTETKTIMPADYIFNSLNNEVLQGKKRWWV